MPYFPNRTLGKANELYDTIAGEFPQNVCWKPRMNPAIITIYAIIFVILSAFILLSMFIGAVCGGMSDAMLEFEAKEAIERATRAAKGANGGDPR